MKRPLPDGTTHPWPLGRITASLSSDVSGRRHIGAGEIPARPYALSLAEEVYGSTLFVMTPLKRDAALVRASELGGQGP